MQFNPCLCILFKRHYRVLTTKEIEINITSYGDKLQLNFFKSSIINMLEKYLLDLNINIIFYWNLRLPVKPVRNHQSHYVSLKLSKPRSHIRNFPYLTKEINSITSSSKIQVLFLLLEELQLLS